MGTTPRWFYLIFPSKSFRFEIRKHGSSGMVPRASSSASRRDSTVGGSFHPHDECGYIEPPTTRFCAGSAAVRPLIKENSRRFPPAGGQGISPFGARLCMHLLTMHCNPRSGSAPCTPRPSPGHTPGDRVPNPVAQLYALAPEGGGGMSWRTAFSRDTTRQHGV